MKRLLLTFFITTMLSTAQAKSLNDAQTDQIIAATTIVVNHIFNAANEKRYLDGLNYYSDDKNAFFVSDGQIQSLEQLKKSYEIAGAAVEDLHNEILEWNVNVLSEELVTFTLPVKLRLKLKGVKEYTGQIIWSAVLKKIDGQWLVVQSHESWLNAAEMTQALSIKE